MSEIFREVDESLREDRMKAQLKRWGPIVGTIAILVVASVAGWMYWQDLQERSAQTETALLLMATDTANSDALSELASEAGDGISVLARLRAGAAAAADGDLETAVSWYEGVVLDPSVPVEWQDYATFMVAWLQLDSGDAGTLRDRLEPLAAQGHPLSFSAQEALALLHMREGELVAAREAFTALANEPNLLPETFERVRELLANLGGPDEEVTQ